MAYSGLEVYLTDHLAGATAGVNLSQMASEEHRADEHVAFFGEIASQIRADYETLERVIAQLGVEKSATKTAAADVGSKIMAPKFVGGDDTRRGPARADRGHAAADRPAGARAHGERLTQRGRRGAMMR